MKKAHSGKRKIVSYGFMFLFLIYLWLSFQQSNIMLYSSSMIFEKEIYFRKTENKNSGKLFCIILTQHKNLMTKAKAVRDTWAKKCDDYKFILKFPNTTLHTELSKLGLLQKNELNAIETDHLLEPPGIVNDTYRKITDKVYLTFKYLHKKHNDYDWYLKTDDDTFIFVDNLRKFLVDKNPTRYYGKTFYRSSENVYNTGGAGYVLSNYALNKLGSRLQENYTFCPNSGFEDVDMAACLRKLNIRPGETKDADGKDRFHQLSILSHYNGNLPKWFSIYSKVKAVKVPYKRFHFFYLYLRFYFFRLRD